METTRDATEFEIMQQEHIEQLKAELAEARAEIERLRQELRDNSTLAVRQIVPAEMLVDDLAAEIERKDKLIEQMREVLRGVCEKCTSARCTHCDIGAALSAAEREII